MTSSLKSRKVLVVYGTRPEAIKMAPLVGALSRSRYLTPVVAVTGQHRHMLDQVNGLFNIRPRYDMNVITERQQLQDITCKVLGGVTNVIQTEKPDAIVVQGDTTTCFAASLAAFYNKVPVVHLEAGLRTGDITNPFPEEANRRLTGQLASLHLAPTPTSKANLRAENVRDDAICITGNTVIDALLDVVSRSLPIENPDLAGILGQPMVLVTAHRRESWGEPMARTARAIARIANTFPHMTFLLPAHLNPVVREVLLPPLQHLKNVVITQPLSYSDFARAMKESTIVLTDSGGVQEEAPSVGKPVLVLRDTTERPEAVEAGTVRLVGTDETQIFEQASTLLTDSKAYEAMAHAVNPYGDGKGGARSVQAIEHFFGLAERPADFDPLGGKIVPLDKHTPAVKTAVSTLAA